MRYFKPWPGTFIVFLNYALNQVNFGRMESLLLPGICLKVFHLMPQQWKNTVQIRQANNWQVNTFATL